jgi:methionyl-tRNA synthetase
MVCLIYSKHVVQVLIKSVSTGVGASTIIVRWTVEKKTFKDAKEAMQRFLEECPKEVIQHFINRSWQFMSAYCKGLTGAAAAWAVCKQKQHRAINQTVMMAIDVLMNPAVPVAGVAKS